MTKTDIKDLLIQIKMFYPRFDSVEKFDGRLAVGQMVIDAWHKHIGWMDYDRAVQILERHMESEEGSRTPSISLWMRNGKAQARAIGYESAYLDKRTGMIVWTPEDGPTFEVPASWNETLGCYEDNEGRLWAEPGE